MKALHRLRTLIHIWAINKGLVQVKPWEDPRRPEWEREMWRQSEPKSMKETG